MKEMTKIITYCGTVTLTLIHDLEKLISLRHYCYQYVCQIRQKSIQDFFSYHAHNIYKANHLLWCCDLDFWPWKVNQLVALSIPMCVPNMGPIGPGLFELSCSHHYTAGGEWLPHDTTISPNPSDACDIMIAKVITYWGQDKMAAILQTTFSYEFSSMKVVAFWLVFHWSLFLRFKMIIFQHWFR